MKIIRLSYEINDESNTLYHFLEYFNTFSLIDCTNKEKIYIDDLTDILILDNYSNSKSIESIFSSISHRLEMITLLIIVDRNKNDDMHLPNSLNILSHVVLTDKMKFNEALEAINSSFKRAA